MNEFILSFCVFNEFVYPILVFNESMCPMNLYLPINHVCINKWIDLSYEFVFLINLFIHPANLITLLSLFLLLLHFLSSFLSPILHPQPVSKLAYLVYLFCLFYLCLCSGRIRKINLGPLGSNYGLGPGFGVRIEPGTKSGQVLGLGYEPQMGLDCI